MINLTYIADNQPELLAEVTKDARGYFIDNFIGAIRVVHDDYIASYMVKNNRMESLPTIGTALFEGIEQFQTRR